MILLVLGLLACGDPGERDRSLYLRTLDATPEEAHALCSRIEDGRLRGECQTHNAAATAVAGDVEQAFALCYAIDDPFWREECWFLAADEAALTGDAAVEACRHAGRYRANCTGHAIGREVKETEKLHEALGQEPELEEAIRAIVHRYKPGAPEHQREATVQTLIARIIAARAPEGPFERGTCGRASAETCARAYRVALDGTPPDVPLEEGCEGALERERIAGLGVRPWAEGSDAIGRLAWHELCADLASGKVVRDPRMGMGVTGDQGRLGGETVAPPAE